MGAYYTLREHDDAAMLNRSKLRGKKPISRGRFIVKALNDLEIQKMKERDPWRQAFRVGDFLEVEYRASAKDNPERVVGICIARHNRGIAASFRLLTKESEVPIEYHWPIYSPLISAIEVRSRLKKIRKASKLYYLREEYNKLNIPKPQRMLPKIVAEKAGPSSGRKRGVN